MGKTNNLPPTYCLLARELYYCIIMNIKWLNFFKETPIRGPERDKISIQRPRGAFMAPGNVWKPKKKQNQ